MATTTPNYALVKPALVDNVDIAVLNANADKMDAHNHNATFVLSSAAQPAAPGTLTIVDRQASDALGGHWVDQLSGSTFFTIFDSVRQIGYNVAPGGGPSNPAGGANYDQWEADYYQNGTARTMERHHNFYTPTNGATTVAAGSNGVNTSTFAGAGVLNVASVAGFPKWGTLTVVTGGTPATITYTGLSGNSFTGCTTTAGGGVLATGGAVTMGAATGGRPYMTQFNWQTGELTQFQLSATSFAFADWQTQVEIASLGKGVFSLLAVAGTNNSIATNAAAGQSSAILMQHNALSAFSISTNSSTNVGVAVGGTTILTLFGGGSTRRMNLGPTADNTHIFTAESDNGNTAINARGFSTQVGDLIRAETSGLAQVFGVTPTGAVRMAKIAAPGANASFGFLYVLSDGTLHYRGPTTDTQLAVA